LPGVVRVLAGEGLRRRRVAGPLPEVALEGLAGLLVEGDDAGSAAFAPDDDLVNVEVERLDGESADLVEPDAAVEEQAQDGVVASVLEALPGHALEQRLEVGVADHRDGGVGDLGASDLGQRRSLELLLFDQPLEELLEGPVA